MLPDAYLGRLAARISATGSCLCLGLDPDPAAMPHGFSADAAGVERFAAMLLDAAMPHAAAVKANLAFFEAFGSAGMAALERLRARVPADVPFIADAKRADIGSTAARQAVAIFDALAADAVTANPYLGLDAIEPFLERADRFVYVLCRTSNPSATELQARLMASQEGGRAGGAAPLYLEVARLVAAWAEQRPRLGLVVGATAPSELALVRAAAPQVAFLVPGIGAQGGDAEAVMRDGPARDGPAGTAPGGALLVSVSRGIAAAAIGADDPEAALAAAAEGWAAELKC